MMKQSEVLKADDRELVDRLKTNPANVAAQLVALTQISDWARVQHRDNFDNYLIAAAELLTRTPTVATDEPSIFDLLEPLSKALIEVGGPDICGNFARGTGGVDIADIVEAVAGKAVATDEDDVLAVGEAAYRQGYDDGAADAMSGNVCGVNIAEGWDAYRDTFARAAISAMAHQP